MSANIENKIIKRSGIDSTLLLDTVIGDFTNAFEGFDGVSFERIDATESDPNKFRIYINNTKTRYIEIADSLTKTNCITYTFRHCDGTADKTHYTRIDGTVNTDKIIYSIARTAYGVAFSILPYCNSSAATISDEYIQNFFAVFEDDEGNKSNGLIFVDNSGDSNSSGNLYISTDFHFTIESLELTRQMFGNTAAHTVLMNAVSYKYPLYAPHLYKKVQTEDGKFGKIKINGTTFISGSHYCLECNEE